MAVAGEGLVGRAAARAAVGAAVDDAVAGRGRLVVVTGEAGMGKTTVAQDVAEAARAAGATVVWTACWPDEPVEHGPWRTVLAAIGPAGAHVAAALAGSDDADPVAAAAARAAAYDGTMATLADAARARPLVVVVDDLHWADDGTIRLLAMLRGRLPSLPLLVVGTYRDDEVTADSSLAAVAAVADHVVLTPLARDDVALLLGAIVGDSVDGSTVDPSMVDDVMHRTGGNPFLVVQVARLLASGGRDVLPAGARDVLRRRLAGLPDDVRYVLEVAAVVGSPFVVSSVSRVAGLGADEVLDAFDRAAAARIVTPAAAPGEWMFVHDLFRVAALDGISATAAASLHRRAADVLIDDRAEPAAIAHHLLAAATGPDEAAAEWSLRAAQTALGAMAWETAAAHADRALAVLPSGRTSDAARGEAWLMLGRARLLSGATDAGVAAFTTAAALARSIGSVDLLARAALGFAADLGGFEVRLFDQRQIDLLEEAAAALQTTQAPALRARVLARLSVALSFAAPTERRLALAEQAVALARAAGDPIVLAGTLAAHCDAIAGPDDTERRLAEASEIVTLAEQAGDGGVELMGRRLRFVSLLELGDIARAHDEMHAFARRAAQVGNPLYGWYVELWRGMWALARGDLAEAARAAAAVVDIGRRAGSQNAPMLAAVLRAELVLQSGRRAELLPLVDEVRDVMGELYDSPQATGNLARLHIELGRDPEARGLLDRFESAGVDSMPRDAEWLTGMATVIQAASELRHPFLGALVDAAIPYADRFAFEGIAAVLHGSLARHVALGCAALGRHDEAVSYARRAMDRNRAAGALVIAHTERTLADALDASTSGTEEAAALHERADQTFTSMGLHHFVRGGVPAPSQPRPAQATPASARDDAAAMRRDGDVWHVSFGGRSTIVKHGKGVADLAVLLARPGQEVHVTELEPLPVEVARTARAAAHDDAIDRRAIAAYRARLQDLDDDLAEAEAAHDLARAERIRVERDFLVDELSSSVGLGGRARASGPDPVERLRKAVTARVRDAIRRIEAVHPALGRHLSNSIRTGAFCSYRPEHPTVWRCEA